MYPNAARVIGAIIHHFPMRFVGHVGMTATDPHDMQKFTPTRTSSVYNTFNPMVL